MNSHLCSCFLPVVILLFGRCEAQISQSLVPAGSVWKYLDDGTDQQTAWRQPGFADTLWKQGTAELGYGDGDETTLVGYGGDINNRHITTYFRKAFTVDDPAVFSGVKLRLLRDDGAVVYLNGLEIRRDNLPTGTIAHTTVANSAVADPDEDTYLDSIIPASALVAGGNTLAVEIHQSGATSSDISFNLELLGVNSNSVSVTRGPYLQLGTPTSVIIRWRTDVAVVGRVAFGTLAGNLDFSADEAAATTEHEVALTGLQPSTRYYYSIGTPVATHLSGPDCAFRTLPPPGTVQPTRIWALGDSGTANSDARSVANAYAAFTQNRPTDVWLMLGDNAYNSGTDTEYQAAVFNMYPSFLRQNVLWSTIGNHETAQSTNPALTIPYFQIFNLPTSGEAGGVASGTEKYYSFDCANIHFICLDSMTSSRSPTGAMAAWLRADLESTTQEWIIAFWHHPPYTKGSHNSDTEGQLIEMRTNFLPILEAGGVDLVLSGHSHSYERSHLLNGHYGLSTSLTQAMILDNTGGRETGGGAYQKPGGNAASQGAVYITAGSSGKISGGTLNHPAMFISLNNLGSMVLDINGPRLDAKFLRENGAVADSFTLLKQTPNQPPTVSLTAPLANAVFATGSDIVVQAAASDPDPNGSIRQVDFYQGNVPLGSDTSAPFEFTWSGADAGTYQLSATATDNLGATVTSPAVTIVVEVPVSPPPAPPTQLTASPGDQRVLLAWQPSSGADTYKLYRSESADGIYAPVTSGLAATTFNDTGLLNGTRYYYVVTAVNIGGESPVSNQADAIPNPPPPDAPTGLSATAGNAQVTLAWTASANADTYTVLRSTVSGSGHVVLAAGLAATSFTDTTTANGTTYYYVVTATNSGGASGPSNQADATPTAPPTPPGTPTNLAAAVASKSRINLSWTDTSSNETGFRIERRQGTGSWTQIAVTAPNVTSFASTGLRTNTTYSYRVRATNAVGNSAYSNEVTATTLRR